VSISAVVRSSLSKTVAPGSRIGWLAPARQMSDALDGRLSR